MTTGLTGTDLLALSPFITLTGVILVLMMAIAFARHLGLTCLIAALGLLVTLANILWVAIFVDPQLVTPLIIVDPYALLFSGLIVIASFFICLLAYNYHQQRGGHQEEFTLLLLLATLGGVTLAHSAHFGSFILGLELLGISLYAMISYPTQGLLSLEAALKYLILSGVSSAFILFGIAFLFATTGTLSFAEMADANINPTAVQGGVQGGVQGSVQGSESLRLYMLIGGSMILAGVGFKLSLVPFHMWTPDVYEGAPAPTTAFLATVSKGGIFAVLLRFFVSVDGYQYQTILDGLFWVALLSIFLGNLLAVMQSNIKRLLAYSSIAHLGYLMVAFLAAAEIGGRQLAIEASLVFLIAYFTTTVGAFGVVCIMSRKLAARDTDQLPDYEGLFWNRPLLAAFFAAMLLSLAGIPLTLGFIGKFYIFAVAVDSELWALLVAVIIGSAIGLFYYLRVIFTMTKRSSVTEGIAIPKAGGWSLVAVTLILIGLGVYPAPVIEWVSAIARTIS